MLNDEFVSRNNEVGMGGGGGGGKGEGSARPNVSMSGTNDRCKSTWRGHLQQPCPGYMLYEGPGTTNQNYPKLYMFDQQFEGNHYILFSFVFNTQKLDRRYIVIICIEKMK